MRDGTQISACQGELLVAPVTESEIMAALKSYF